MKIILTGEDENEKQELLTLSDEALENDAFVEVTFLGKTLIFGIYELIPALIAFEAKRSKRLCDEAQMEE